jgi:hypothetical protein
MRQCCPALVPLGNGIHDQPEKEEYPEADPEANGSSKHHALQPTAGIDIRSFLTRIVWTERED